jgi:hypothetical protein
MDKIVTVNLACIINAFALADTPPSVVERMAHTRQSRPESARGFQVKVLIQF